MITTIAAFVAAITATLVSSVLAALSYWHYRRQIIRTWQREQRLPDATRYDHLQSLVKELESERDSLRADVRSSEVIIEEAQRQREWMQQAQQELAMLESRKHEIIQIESDLASKQNELLDINDRLSKDRASETELKDQLKKIQSEQTQEEQNLNDLRSSCQKLTQRQAEMVELVSSLEKKGAELTTSCGQLESQKRTLENEQRTLVEKKDKLERELSSIEKSLSEQKQAKSTLESQIEQLRKLVGELEGKKTALGVEVEATTKFAERLSSNNGPVNLSESDLWLPSIPAVKSSPFKHQEEIECLDRLESSLQNIGLKFDQRTVYAFHTSLKSTNSSPLVTLAGVSGTGKSELPRRYADALGINFLNVAVQPRWDSPQDLFGFYDYLERRYRPTEMTRALLQMDMIGNLQGRGWHPPDSYKSERLNDQMLLVLLDEMNLARVEYYFSEFLSKLETRRNIDTKLESARRNAEIVLEVSGRQAGALPLRFFVGNNVLFVGTMNEDESTQALSDKVIDRSNILRFGSPTKFEPASPLSNGNTPSGSSNKILHQQWTGWSSPWNTLKASDQNTLVNWIERIRKPLDAVGRPFAYRVSYAILEYASNYPQVPERINNAIADQIEQRMLPKLIGLDMQDSNFITAIDAIRKVLDEAGDQKLIEKLDQNRRQDDYFKWHGIDRTV